jgi:hypothetical protein
MKTYGGVEVYMYTFFTSVLMEMCGVWLRRMREKNFSQVVHTVA